MASIAEVPEVTDDACHDDGKSGRNSTARGHPDTVRLILDALLTTQRTHFPYDMGSYSKGRATSRFVARTQRPDYS